jgi:DNA-binding transcriptional regulator LsrR (DeoR family)
LAEGLTNREIARRLKLTEHTVKNYLFRIFDKLGVSSRVEVVLYALGGGTTHAPKATPNTRRARPATFARAKSPVMSVGIQKDKH